MDSNIEVFYMQLGDPSGKVQFLKKRVDPIELSKTINLLGNQVSVIGIYSPVRNEFTLTQKDQNAFHVLLNFILMHYKDVIIVTKDGRLNSEALREKMKSNSAVEDLLKELNIPKS